MTHVDREQPPAHQVRTGKGLSTRWTSRPECKNGGSNEECGPEHLTPLRRILTQFDEIIRRNLSLCSLAEQFVFLAHLFPCHLPCIWKSTGSALKGDFIY
jgi:hypothetical protein